jgi:hypothetical protein
LQGELKKAHKNWITNKKLNKKKYNTILPKSNTTMAPGHCLRYEPLGI